MSYLPATSGCATDGDEDWEAIAARELEALDGCNLEDLDELEKAEERKQSAARDESLQEDNEPVWICLYSDTTRMNSGRPALWLA